MSFKRPWEMPTLLCGECGHALMWVSMPRQHSGRATVRCTASDCKQREEQVEVRLRKVRITTHEKPTA